MRYLGDNGNGWITGRFTASASGTSSPIALPTFDRINPPSNTSRVWKREVLCVVDATGNAATSAKMQMTAEDPESLSAQSIWFDWSPGTITGTASGVVIDAPVTAVRLVGAGTSATSTTSGAGQTVYMTLTM